MIFSIEKRRFRRGGKLEETRSYYLRYRIGDMPVDKWKSLGVTDKQVADKKAHEFIQERERETAGILGTESRPGLGQKGADGSPWTITWLIWRRGAAMVAGAVGRGWSPPGLRFC